MTHRKQFLKVLKRRYMQSKSHAITKVTSVSLIYIPTGIVEICDRVYLVLVSEKNLINSLSNMLLILYMNVLPILFLTIVYFSSLFFFTSFMTYLLFSILQPVVEFNENIRYCIKVGAQLYGLCCDDKKLYCIEGWYKDREVWLTVYSIEPGITEPQLLDSVQVKNMGDWHERCASHSVQKQSDHIYISHPQGVLIFRYEGIRLELIKTLNCLGWVYCVAACSTDTEVICGYGTSVFLVDVTKDISIRQFDKPLGAEHMSVLGKTVLVCHGDKTLVIYTIDGSGPGRILRITEGMEKVSSITTDGHSRFLILHSKYISVLDEEGNHRQTMDFNVNSLLGPIHGCAVFQSQICLGYVSGIISMMKCQ